jgi:hypothetical protein
MRGDILTSLGPVSFSGRLLFREVSYLITVIRYCFVVWRAVRSRREPSVWRCYWKEQLQDSPRISNFILFLVADLTQFSRSFFEKIISSLDIAHLQPQCNSLVDSQRTSAVAALCDVSSCVTSIKINVNTYESSL